MPSRSKFILFLSTISFIFKKATCFDIDIDINTKGVTTSDYANFGAGVLISSFVELAANTPNYPCVNSFANIMSSAYMIMFYY